METCCVQSQYDGMWPVQALVVQPIEKALIKPLIISLVEFLLFAPWICLCFYYRVIIIFAIYFLLHSFHIGAELLRSDSLSGGDSMLKNLWHHENAILCCSLKVQSSFVYKLKIRSNLNFIIIASESSAEPLSKHNCGSHCLTVTASIHLRKPSRT